MQQKSTPAKTVAIIAGEASGDLHGAHLINALRDKRENLTFCGIGGHALKEAGVRILVDSDTLSVIGITEVLSKFSTIYRGLKTAKEMLRRDRPDLLILVDFPDFNLRVAPVARKLGIPVLYYISPQVWAWRAGRVRKIRRCVDRMAVIFPFETDFYKKHGVPVSFVGHPLMDNELPPLPQPFSSTSLPEPVIGLLPGSREGEVQQHLPVMLDAISHLRKERPELQYLVSLASSMNRTTVENIIRSHNQNNIVELVTGGAGEVLKRCNLAITASGTATLETAIYGVPMVIIYKVSSLSYRLAKAMVQVDHIGLVNLVAGKRIVPELIQHEASGQNIARTAASMLQQPDGLMKIRQELLLVREKLGCPGASGRTADLALEMMKSD